MPQPDILQFVDQRTGPGAESAGPGPPRLPAERTEHGYRGPSPTRQTVSGWISSRSTAGCAWWDPDVARIAAIGEAIEHYCGSLVPSDLRRASYQELVSNGEARDPPGRHMPSTKPLNTWNLDSPSFLAHLIFRCIGRRVATSTASNKPGFPRRWFLPPTFTLRIPLGANR